MGSSDYHKPAVKVGRLDFDEVGRAEVVVEEAAALLRRRLLILGVGAFLGVEPRLDMYFFPLLVAAEEAGAR